MKAIRIIACIIVTSFAAFIPVASGLTSEELAAIRVTKAKAIVHFNEGKYELALPLIEKVLAIDPEDRTAQRYILLFNTQIVEPYCKMAVDAYLDGDYPKAITHWERVLELNPDDYKVATLIEETVTLQADDAIESYYANASRFLKEGEHERATFELEKILLIKPKEDRAREMLETARRTLIDNMVREHYARADQYLKDENYELALTEWKKVLEIDPSQELASRMIADAHRQSLDDMYTRGRRLYLQGDYMGARDTFNHVLAENPTDSELKNIVARLNETIRVVPQIVQDDRVSEVLRRALYHHLSEKGKPKVAVAASWYAAQLAPDNAIVMAVRDFIEAQHVSVIRTMEPPSEDMNITEQYLFASLNHIYEGRYDLAVQECNLVLDIEPESVLALKRLGSAYFAMGRKDKAREAWQLALERDPDDNELKAFIRQAR